MNEVKKNPNKGLFVFKMMIFFVIAFMLTSILPSILSVSIYNLPGGFLLVGEAFSAVIAIIILLLFKNSYVFTQKREKLGVGLFYGLFYLIGAVFFTLYYGIGCGAFKANLFSAVNIFLGCICVGMFEEFLCRGWLLNEFLERYGHDKDGVWFSIIVSGLVFGCFHFVNVFAGQDFASTVIQVLNASATGIIFGLIYYKTKNIWSVVLLHGLWDFGLFTSELAPITSLTASSTKISFLTICFSILIVIVELLIIIPHIKDIDAKPKNILVILISIGAFIIYAFLTYSMDSFYVTFGDTYEFGNLSLKHYAVTNDNYDKYAINYGEYNFEFLFDDDNNLTLTNLKTNYSITFEYTSLYDYIIVEDENYYILAYTDMIDSSNFYLNYIYLYKSGLSNEDQYLDNVKSNMKKYMLPNSDIGATSSLVVLNDYETGKVYLSNYSQECGYAVLVSEDNMAILNRD